MNTKRPFLIGLLLGGLTAANAQDGTVADDTTSANLTPQGLIPAVIVPRIGKATVVFPGQAPIKVKKEELGDVLGAYAQEITQRYAPSYAESEQDANGGLLPHVGGGDGLSGEIEQILGESEQAIMSGIKDELQQLIGNALNTSPVSEVVRLKKMVKDAYTKQQRVAYQEYKVDYAWKKAHTELSKGFISYYSKLNLKDSFAAVERAYGECRQILADPVFTATESADCEKQLKTLAESKDLVSEVNIVCNRGSGSSSAGETSVWMSEAERVTILDQVHDELMDRLNQLLDYRQKLLGVVSYRYKQAYRNQAAQRLYRENTALNRSIKNLKTKPY